MAPQHVHGGNLALAAREYGFEPRDMMDFSASINPLGPSPRSLLAIRENLWQIAHYPDTRCHSLRERMAGYLGTGPECITVGNGAAELIYLLPRVFNVKRALIPVPTFSEYEISLLNAGGVVRCIPLDCKNGFNLPLGDMVRELPGTDVIFLCNPNNPTGTLYVREELIYLLEAAREQGVLLVIDEAFMDFVQEKERISLISYVNKYRNLVVLYSLTKFLAIPGLRLGAVITNPDTASEFDRVRDPWSVNALSQVAGEAGLGDWEYMRSTVETVTRERNFLYEELSAIKGVVPYPGRANFLLADMSGTGFSPQQIVRKLAVRGILVRDCSNFKGLDIPCIRVAVRKREENRILVRTLAEILEGDEL